MKLWQSTSVSLALTLLLGMPAQGADAPASGVQLPNFGDDYSALAARAAAHDESIDFRALRLAFLKSPAYQKVGVATASLAQLNREMVDATHQPVSVGAPIVRQKAEQFLSIDYIDINAHKLLRQSCAALKDDACVEANHFVEFGLLNSIIHSGTGDTCAKGWEVVDIREEYFVLATVLNTKFQKQSLVSEDGHACDVMAVTDEKGAPRTYYFNVDHVMAALQAELDKSAKKPTTP